MIGGALPIDRFIFRSSYNVPTILGS
ncbi:unnamed protein product [Victoria cruziana]